MNTAKLKNESKVARIFCAALTEVLKQECEVIAPGEPPAADFLVRIGEKLVSLELARYRETGPHNTAYTRDLELKAFLFDLFRQTGVDRLPHCMVRMTYRRGAKGRFLIPRRNEHPSFGSDILALLACCRRPEHEELTRFHFLAAEKIPAYDRLEPAVRHIPVGRYASLDRFCEEIDLLWSRYDVPIGLPSSSMDARGTAIDFAEINRKIRDKHDNLGEYRRQQPGAPVWLLYYAEGYLSTGRLPGRGHNSEVVEHLRQLIARETDKFDAVWWADDLFAMHGPKLFKVI